MQRVAWIALSLVAMAALACSGDKDETPAAVTVFPELQATAGPTAIPPPLPTPITEVPGTVWLIDVAAGDVVTLFEDNQENAPTALFDDENASVLYQAPEGTVRKDYSGTQLELYEQQGPQGVLLGTNPWRSTDQGCEYKGRLYEGVPCGGVSPNERWMTYHLNSRELEPTGSEYDLWTVDLETGETRELLHGLFQCTQCDVGATIHWSASGRYLGTGNAGGNAGFFLVDLETGMSRDITVSHLTTLGVGPQWSPVADLLLRPGEDGGTLLEDIAAGTQAELADVPWPAYFDPSGAYVYSVPEVSGPSRPDVETVIADAATGELIATLAGIGGYNITESGIRYRLIPPHPVLGSPDGFVAALVGAPGCEGTMIYQNEAVVTCVSGAIAPVFSFDGSRLILARRIGATGPVQSPTIESVGIDIYELIVVDIATGQERTLAQGALSFDGPPDVGWNAAGTHVLVRWPNHYGP